jgi:hypothetical protein
MLAPVCPHCHVAMVRYDRMRMVRGHLDRYRCESIRCAACGGRCLVRETADSNAERRSIA